MLIQKLQLCTAIALFLCKLVGMLWEWKKESNKYHELKESLSSKFVCARIEKKGHFGAYQYAMWLYMILQMQMILIIQLIFMCP